MMSDKELLELAAKAAGIDYKHDNSFWAHEDHCAFWSYADLCTCGGRWNPLTDDGDALRLAIKLDLSIHTFYSDGVSSACSGVPYFVDEEVIHNGDPYAATRRAIVRAAAEIGKEKK